jgi:hypothetical protein
VTATFRRLDVSLLAGGAALTLAFAFLTAGPVGTLPFMAFAGLVAFAATAVAFATVPHVAIAATIPIFATLPTVKTLFLPEAGGVKDAIVLAAACGAFVVALANMRAGRGSGVDRRIGIAVLAVLALYVVNLGGGLSSSAYDGGWAHAVRLTAEPLLLLCVGLVLGSRRTLRWAVASLIVTGVGVALYGLWQQYVGQWYLVGVGYSFDDEVRALNGRLRSFGTLDEPFAYAGFLLFPLAAVMFLAPRRAPIVVAGAVVAAGIAVSYVRSALVIVVALGALWALRRGHVIQAVFVLGATVAAAVGLLVASTGATQTRTVEAQPSLYLTVNGRTDVWRVALKEPSTWPFGQGAGEVGAAAARAARDGERSDRPVSSSAVDSAYFATIADIGLVGLVVRLALFGTLVAMAWGAAKAGLTGGWFALSLLTILALDALTRDSFTGFPTAFLGLLLVGLALAAAREEDAERRLA